MKRKALKQIEEWYHRPKFKPLLLNGARQVGKTWLMLEFARKHYEGNFVYVNFEAEHLLKDLFAADYDIQRIERTISLALNVEINQDTLFIFDELPAAERGVSALKYFHEQAPSRRILAAGSLLGISIHVNDSFPVGKVEMLDVYPLDFDEFLHATGNAAILDAINHSQWELLESVRLKIENLLKQYFFVGGMPEIVENYISTDNFGSVRRLQEEILRNYELDFSKHAPLSELPRIRMVWQSIPGQLAKDNHKFIYNKLRQGARAKDFEIAIEWLKNAGLISIVNRVSKGELPLKAYESFNIFKIYLLDIGLLGAMCGLSASTIIEGNKLFATFKGAFTEQYICQQMTAARCRPIDYWSADNSRGEVDFVTEFDETVIPIEVKSGENLQSKSLKAFCARYGLSKSIRFSLAGYQEQEHLTNVPLWAACSYLEKISAK